MTTARYLIALDQGTTSTRAVLFDEAGNELAEASRPLAQSYPANGWVEHDPEAIFLSSTQVIRQVLEARADIADQVVALGITNQRETIVVWDRVTGRPIYPAIVWQDRRTEPFCVQLRDQGLEPEISEITGLLVDPYFSGTKLKWILDEVPGARDRANRGELLAGTIDCWLIWNLTGGEVHATDVTNASRTLLFDLNRLEWSDRMLDLLDVPSGLLPSIRDCADDYGTAVASHLGRDLPIRGVAGDQQAALMGQGATAQGSMKATYGTGCFLLLNTGTERPRSSNRLLATVASRHAGKVHYALEGSIFVAGAALQWLNEGLRLPGGGAGAEALASTAKDDSGVVFVPALTGLGAPWWDADARGAIFGLTRDSDMADIARAAFDACALQTRDLLSAMRADIPSAFGPDAELRIDGGMSRSQWFAQQLSDLVGATVLRSLYQETTALGAALFAGVGAGIWQSLDQAAISRPQTQSFQPLRTAAWRDRHYAKWLEAVGRLTQSRA
jgi:glycerol kinase